VRPWKIAAEWSEKRGLEREKSKCAKRREGLPKLYRILQGERKKSEDQEDILGSLVQQVEKSLRRPQERKRKPKPRKKTSDKVLEKGRIHYSIRGECSRKERRARQ